MERNLVRGGEVRKTESQKDFCWRKCSERSLVAVYSRSDCIWDFNRTSAG